MINTFSIVRRPVFLALGTVGSLALGAAILASGALSFASASASNSTSASTSVPGGMDSSNEVTIASLIDTVVQETGATFVAAEDIRRLGSLHVYGAVNVHEQPFQALGYYLQSSGLTFVPLDKASGTYQLIRTDEIQRRAYSVVDNPAELPADEFVGTLVVKIDAGTDPTGLASSLQSRLARGGDISNPVRTGNGFVLLITDLRPNLDKIYALLQHMGRVSNVTQPGRTEGRGNSE